jgi:hypothetical protein
VIAVAVGYEQLVGRSIDVLVSRAVEAPSASRCLSAQRCSPTM